MKKSAEKVIEKRKVLNKLSLDCDECGHHMGGSDININSTLAKCSNCGTVYFLKDDEFFIGDRSLKPEMMIPEGTEVLHLPSSLDIRVNRYQSVTKSELTFKTFFTLFWNFVVLIVAGAMIASGTLVPLLFMSFHILVGIGSIVVLAQTLFNYTDVIVDDYDLKITNRPIRGFWNRDKTYDKKDIQQLYVSRYVSSKTNGQPNHAYALYAILNNGKKVQLVKGMNKETQLYLEQELERFLSIDDEHVSGSVSK
jgi:hypothetical protein